MAVFAGVTMVSNVPFWSFKEVNWKKRVPLWVILALVVGFSIVASSPSLVLFGAVHGVRLLRLRHVGDGPPRPADAAGR